MASAPMTSTTEIPSAVSEFYDRNLLERAKPYLCHDKFGQRRPFKSHSGMTIRFRRYNALAPATTPLTEGVTPTGNQLSKTDYTAPLKQYGDWTKITDVVDFSNVDPVITEAVDVFSDQAGLSIDTVYRDILLAGTNLYYTNGTAVNTINTYVSQADLENISRSLKRAKGVMFTELIKAGSGINTFPVRPCFVIVAHVDLEKTFRAMADFISIEKYASQGGVMDNEIGAVGNFRIVLTTNAYTLANGGATVANGCYSTGAANCDVYKSLVFAKNAYGICPLDGDSFKTIVKKNEGGYGDPLNQIAATVAWKANTTACILNETWMICLISGAKA